MQYFIFITNNEGSALRTFRYFYSVQEFVIVISCEFTIGNVVEILMSVNTTIWAVKGIAVQRWWDIFDHVNNIMVKIIKSRIILFAFILFKKNLQTIG